MENEDFVHKWLEKLIRNRIKTMFKKLETQILDNIMSMLQQDKNHEKYIHDLWEEVKICKEDEEYKNMVIDINWYREHNRLYNIYKFERR